MKTSSVKTGRPESKRSKDHIEKVILNLANHNGIVREQARKTLAQMGASAIPQLAKHTHAKNVILRWEVIKTLAEIVDPAAAPLLIAALEDDISSIRWVAAEGLVNLQSAALKPVLNELINKPGSILLREGAHHILWQIKKRQKNKLLNPMLRALESKEIAERIPVIADNILKKLE
jgi:HEAT repeat protein